MTKVLEQGKIAAATKPQEKASTEAQAKAILQSKIKNVIADTKELEQENEILKDALKRKIAEIEILKKTEKENTEELRTLRVSEIKLKKQVNELKSDLDSVKLPKNAQDTLKLINTYKSNFTKIVNVDFYNDLKELEKTNKNKGFITTNYFNELFILLFFKENKRQYTFKSFFEQLIFDTLYFKYQNNKGDAIIQAEYITNNTVKFVVISENMTPQQIEYYNRVKDCNIPANYKAEQEKELQEQAQIDTSIY